MATYTEEQYREVVKKHNILVQENFLLETENESLRDTEHCECWGWKIVCIGLCVYIAVSWFL